MIIGKNFKKTVVLGIAVLTIFVSGCYQGGHSALSGSEHEKIVSEIETDISKNPAPADFNVVTNALYALYPKAFEKIAANYFEEATFVNQKISNFNKRELTISFYSRYSESLGSEVYFPGSIRKTSREFFAPNISVME